LGNLALTIGFGAEPWGDGPSGWGSPVPTDNLELLSAVAIRENVFQLTFSLPIYLSGLLDLPDGSIPSKYAIAAINTTGLDGNRVRPVTAVNVAYAQPISAGGDLPNGATYGAVLDVTTDRPMSPYPCQYQITLTNLFDTTLASALDPLNSSLAVLAVWRQFVPPQVQLPTPTRDFANPQTLSAVLDPLPNPGNPLNLGIFPVADGDYALDQGLVSYKKRVFRRLVTKPGGFLHLGQSYGVGIGLHGKQLAKPSTRNSLASNAESQIGQEPETEACTVNAVVDANAPGLTRFVILAKTKGGQVSKFTAAFPPP
jgi:hypothetical protein